MTVPTADLYSEAFSAMGNVVAEGIWNQLGRPELDRLTLLIRESVQNSWDARKSETIRYSIDSLRLSPAQRESFGRFFAKQPPDGAYASPSKLVEEIESIDTWLKQEPKILVVSDRGTSGLDGPTRADEAVANDEPRSFVNFLRNIGQPPGRAHTGGTFGYGKAAFYLASEARTIVVYTRCLHRGRLETRLTAASLTHNFSQRGRRFTGRHWWGRLQRDVIEPYVDAEADAIAKALGLPGFVGDECGTTVAVAAPAFEDSELKAIDKICLRHLWPKLKAPNQKRPPISLAASISGVPVQIPDPSKTPPYDAYWRAYCALYSGTDSDIKDIKYNRDVVGRLALAKALMITHQDQHDVPEHEVRPQHVALLRTPELVVKYLDAGRSLGNDKVGFVGVFHTAADHDDSFARSEPPTHDDWQPLSVSDKRARGLVQMALRRIREHCRDYATLHSPRVQGAEGSPLAKLAGEFAVLAPGLGARPGTRADRPSGGSPTSRRDRKPRPQVRVEGEQQGGVEEVEGRLYAVFVADVTHAAGSEMTELHADVYPVVSGGAREVDAPSGRAAARIGWWESPRGTRVEGNPLRVGPRQQGLWKLYVPIEDAVAVAVEIDARSEQAT